MATGRKTVVVGQVIDPTTWGNPLWDQSVQQFASSADRAAQFATPLKGAVTWLDDVRRLDVWDGTAWRAVEQTTYATATFGAGVVAISSAFTPGTLVKTGKLVTFVGAAKLSTGGTIGSIVWNIPAGYVPATTEGAVIVGWMGGTMARYEIIGGASAITYQEGGSPVANALLSATASWKTP